MDRSDQAETARTVLFVAYHYPPMRSGGVERSAKFAHYLPEFGYRPRVLTTRAFGNPGDDGVLRAWEPVALYRRLFNPAARRDPVVATRARTQSPLTGWSAWSRRWMLVPDGQITWLPGAAWSALRWLRRQGADLIYTTSPPASAHLLGRFLHQQTGLPWVADFRDAWLYDPLDPALLTMPYRRELERRLEARVLADADAVIAATHTCAEDLRSRYPAAAARVRVVTNGFDPADGMALPEGLVIDDTVRVGPADEGATPEPAASSVDRRLRLVHTGSFAYSHPERTPVPLLRALQRLVDTEPVWAERLELTLVGELSPDEQAAASSLTESGTARLVGPVDRTTALGYQRRADVLLVVDHRRPWPASNAPGKLFEYLAAGKPVLALCGEGEVRRTVTDLGAGLCAPPDDVDGIEAALRDVWAAHVAGKLPRVHSGLGHFHRRELSGQLAACFDQVLGD